MQDAEPRRLTADEQQASPEKQELYETFVSKAFMLIYDEKMLPKVVEMLKGEGDRNEGLAIAASQIVARVLTATKDAGQVIAGDVMFHGAKKNFEGLAELARLSGVKDSARIPTCWRAPI